MWSFATVGIRGVLLPNAQSQLKLMWSFATVGIRGVLLLNAHSQVSVVIGDSGYSRLWSFATVGIRYGNRFVLYTNHDSEKLGRIIPLK